MGNQEYGTGLVTSYKQLVSDQLGVDPDRVDVGSERHMVQTVVAHRRKLPAWDSRDGCPFRRSVSNASGNLVSILSFGIDKKILRDLLSCGWRRLMFRTAGEDIPVPPLKIKKQLSYLGGQQ